MHLLPFLAQSECSGGSALDWMLRAIGVAAIVWAFFNGLRSLLVKKTAAAAPTPVTVNPHPIPAASIEQDIPPEIVVAIAAAVHFVSTRSHRIISMKRVDPAWEKSGRQSVLTSHRIR